MADITKCKGTKCPLKRTCYRYTAKADKWQSYYVEVPYKDGNCNEYWNIRGEVIGVTEDGEYVQYNGCLYQKVKEYKNVYLL